VLNLEKLIASAVEPVIFPLWYLFSLNGIGMKVLGGSHCIFLLCWSCVVNHKPHLTTKWKQSASQRN